MSGFNKKHGPRVPLILPKREEAVQETLPPHMQAKMLKALKNKKILVVSAERNVHEHPVAKNLKAKGVHIAVSKHAPDHPNNVVSIHDEALFIRYIEHKEDENDKEKVTSVERVTQRLVDAVFLLNPGIDDGKSNIVCQALANKLDGNVPVVVVDTCPDNYQHLLALRGKEGVTCFGKKADKTAHEPSAVVLAVATAIHNRSQQQSAQTR